MIVKLITFPLFLALIVFIIPLAFDVGGRTCGLGFSLSLAVFYTFYGLLRLVTPDRSLVRKTFFRLVQASQWLFIFSLLIWSLNKFSDADTTGDDAAAAAGDHTRRPPTPGKAGPERGDSWDERIFGRAGLLETLAIGGWEKLLLYSAPFFQLAEGFCSLLIIQAAGRIARWLVERERGDSWMIFLLTISAGIFSSAFYFLYRIITFPAIDNLDGILIGCTITCALFLCIGTIASRRGNSVECSLLFAYITLCLYLIFTDANANAEVPVATTPDQPALPPLPPIFMASYTTFLAALQSLPVKILTSFDFIMAAVSTITPSVLISLIYRVVVIFAVSRLIPIMHDDGVNGLTFEPTAAAAAAASMDDSDDDVNRVMSAFAMFSPAFLVAVYTSLLLQHFDNGGIDSVVASAASAAAQPGASGIANTVGTNLWKWLNVGLTMGLYAYGAHVAE